MLCLFQLLALFTFLQLAGASPEAPTEVEWGPWHALMPFHNPGGGGNQIDKSFSPEKEVKSLRLNGPGPKLSRKHKGKLKQDIMWRELAPAPGDGPDFALLDFRELLPPEFAGKGIAATDKSVAYIHRTITSSRRIELSMGLGSDDGCRVWLNGKLIHSMEVARGIDPDGDPLLLSLSRGVNHILIKVSNGGGGWGAHLHPARLTNLPQASVPQEAINAAIDRGSLHLLKTQLLDGSWGYEATKYRNGQTALAAYALMKSGLRPDHPAIRRALLFVAAQPSKTTYGVTCEMLALSARNRAADRLKLTELGARLEEWQFGGFGYPEGTMDLSNSQYGALGLLIGHQAGAKISPRTWAGVLRSTLRCQNDDGGFGYRENGASNGSMTVAGLTVLYATLAAHGEKGLPAKWRTQVRESLAMGLEWLINNFRVDVNPKSGPGGKRWSYYYLYGIERMAALGNLRLIGDRDWYSEGAGYLIRNQRDNDSWGTASGEESVNTCFALIFLARATAAITGQHTPNRHQRVYATDLSDGPVLLRATGDTPLSLWVSQFSPEVMEKHSRDGEGRHGLYIDRVVYLADGEEVHQVMANRTQPWNQERFAFQYEFEHRGDHEVQVHVHLSADPAKPHLTAVVLESPVLKVRVDETPEAWMFDYPDDAFANLLLDRDFKVEASSIRNPGNSELRAFDGLMGTGWACAGTDLVPNLSLRLQGSIRADRVILSHRTSSEDMRSKFDVATEIELRINGSSKPIVFSMDPNEELKTVLELPKTMRVGRLSITITGREKGTQFQGSVGFAEVELRLGE
jgi:hypothetical protein